jgi:hypothetical protein
MPGITIALIVVSSVLAVFVGAFIFRKDTEKENRRKAAIAGSQVASSFGLTHLPKLLTCYAVGDYSGIAHEVKELAKLSLNPVLLQAEMDSVLAAVVQKKAATPEGKAELLKLIG